MTNDLYYEGIRFSVSKKKSITKLKEKRIFALMHFVMKMI